MKLPNSNYISEIRYRIPIDPVDYIKRIVIGENAPGHKIWKTEDGKIFDERNAIDFIAEEGANVVAAADGVVVKVVAGINKTWQGYSPPPKHIMDESEWEGNWVLVKHPYGEFTKYAHLGKVYVQEGQEVKKGQVIGEIGYSGWCPKPKDVKKYLPHLHFEVLKFLNPLPTGDRSYVTLKVLFDEEYKALIAKLAK